MPGLLAALQMVYEKRGVNLCLCRQGKYQFRTASDLAFLLRKEQPEQRRLVQGRDRRPWRSSPITQPVTRAEIEDIRGVAISKGTIRHLDGGGLGEDQGPHSTHTPGHPVTYGTTEAFPWSSSGWKAISHLPGHRRTQGRRLPGGDAAVGSFERPRNPSDMLGPDEDPYTGEEPEDMATGNLNLDQA